MSSGDIRHDEKEEHLFSTLIVWIIQKMRVKLPFVAKIGLTCPCQIIIVIHMYEIPKSRRKVITIGDIV